MSSRMKQLQFEGKPSWTFRYCHGGVLRNRRKGRKQRPLSTREPIHLVLKANKSSLRRGLRSPLGQKIVTDTFKKYAKRFFVKIEQCSIQPDHIHLLIRLSRRSLGQYFFRVVAGQIAQEFLKFGMMATSTDSNITGKLKNKGVTDTPNAPESPDAPNTSQVQYDRALEGNISRGNVDFLDNVNREIGRNKMDNSKSEGGGKIRGSSVVGVLWKYRPYTRVIRGWKPYLIVRDYIRLNEQEARGVIKYNSKRLKGLSSSEWELLWR